LANRSCFEKYKNFEIMNKIAIFASGSGSNAENIVLYFRNKNIDIDFIFLTNNKNAFVLERAKKLNIKSYLFNKKELKEGIVNKILENFNPDLIVLAGFLLLVPESIISKYPNKIINIHPALLPKYGGKGMYGNNVHKAVLENKEKISGITIHYVNNEYDKGNIIFQKECPINDEDNVETLANKVHKLEYDYFPQTIEKLLNKI